MKEVYMDFGDILEQWEASTNKKTKDQNKPRKRLPNAPRLQREEKGLAIEDQLPEEECETRKTYQSAEKSNPEISILSEEYLEGIKKSKNKNIAAALLKRLIDGNIKIFKRTNLVKSELFSQKMAEIMKKYNNRLITSAEVIEELLNLSKELVEAKNEGKEKGLTDDEYAFYDALVKDPNVLKEMKDEVLIQLAHELTETVRKNRTVDWDKKESARAFMRREIKRLLRKYHYPPTKADEAVQTVVMQAELMGENYDIKSSENKNANVKSSIQYSVNNSENLGMVAEESEKYKYE